MSESAEVVRRMYAARDRGDAEGMLACFDRDVVLDASVRLDGAVVRGQEELVRVIGEWIGEFEDWSEEIHEIRGVGHLVYVDATQSGRGKGSGLEIKTRYGLLYEVLNGRIMRMTLFVEPAEALAAAGARE